MLRARGQKQLEASHFKYSAAFRCWESKRWEKQNTFTHTKADTKQKVVEKKSAMTDQNKGWSFVASGQHQHSSQWNTDRRHVVLAVSPSLCSAPTARHLPPAATEGPQRLDRGPRRRAASCISMQTRRIGLSARRAVSLPRLTPRAPQPVQHSSAFIFISRGTASCHSLGKSTPKISYVVCIALTQEVLLKVYHLYCLGRTTLQHSQTPVSFGSFNIKGFKCQMFTSIIRRRRINSLKTLYPQGDGWLFVVYQPQLGSAGGGKAVVFHLLHRVLSLFSLFFSPSLLWV